ncbi:restriction endonuclease subunit S [uncultured Campylobacter sp.]|uniref:restriction endonuclease subunit S n=1 Tax=uncultured Campylobacter sp. TaxID=218934 RepID=UPI0026157838|nr:restriction endonuclease subunit S [uncultured Campylobacter sp.]
MLSPRLKELEENFKQSGGFYKEFKIGDLFSVKSSKKIFHANNIEILDNQVEKSYPYVVRSTRNNGIRGYIMENKEFLNPANTLSFAQDTFSVFYQEQAYFTGNKVKILIPKIKKFNRKIAIFMTSIYGKVLQDFTWGIGSTEDSIKDIIISLPVLPNGEIAFEYMESYIKELEAERLEELEAYLLTTGLKDYKLTEQEKAILQDFAKLQDENSKRGGAFSSLEDYLLYGGSLLDSKKQNFITHALSCLTQRALKSLDTSKWQEFRIGDLFDVISLKKLNPLDSREFRVKEMDEEHPIPAVVAKVGNNGVMYYVGKNDYEITSNKIVIIADGAVASGLVYYHEKEFTILHNAYAIELKQKEFAKKENYLFLATVIQKSIFEAFTYEFKPTWNKVKQEFISLPVLPDNNIAFEYMESFIKEIEKEHFLSLIEYYHKEMSAYNEVIETNGGGH